MLLLLLLLLLLLPAWLLQAWRWRRAKHSTAAALGQALPLAPAGPLTAAATAWLLLDAGLIPRPTLLLLLPAASGGPATAAAAAATAGVATPACCSH